MKSRFTKLSIVLCVLVLKCRANSDVFWRQMPSLPPIRLHQCSDTQFICTNGECIDLDFRCNHVFDCSDKSDEEDCDCPKPNFFRCLDSKCISKSDVCNNFNDCSEGEDEKDCENQNQVQINPPCDDQHFRCSKSQHCIPKRWTCDGADDCGDNSDETLGCEEKKCENYEFKCKNHRCIPLSLRCNSVNDCNDNSDEDNCDFGILDMSNCTINEGKFACEDKLRCIDIFNACDNKTDCFDGSDEGRLCSTDLPKVCGNCTHECHRTPHKAVCVCRSGFVLDSSNKCQDVNECEEYGICDQRCLNLEGSYSCGCDLPYKLQSDKKTCKLPGNDALLFYTSSTGIKSVHLQSLRSSGVIRFHEEASLGVAVAGSNIYWTIIHHESSGIYKASVNDYKSHMIITSGVGIPEDLDVDWITGNIYFADSKFKHIGVCNDAGGVCTILHHKNIDKPRSISVSPENGLLFWTDWGSKPMIGKSGMDGSKAEIFVDENIIWPNGICTDTPNERVYWVDASREIIESIKFDGTDRRVVLYDHVKSPVSISVFENKLYWSNSEGNEILECDKFTGKNTRSLIRDTSEQIFGVHVQHPKHQTQKNENPCDSNPCSDICLLAPGSKSHPRYSCACPYDKEMSENLNTCHTKKSPIFLIAAFKNKVHIVEYKYLGRPRIKPYELNVKSISSMVYEYSHSKLVVADSKSGLLRSFTIVEENLETLPTQGILHVPSIQYDDHGHNLYWCDWESLTIEAMSLKTFSKTVVLSGTTVEFPIDIALAPSEGYMFVAFIISNSRVQIDRLSMDGSLNSRTPFLYDKLTGPILKMYFDVLEKRLFWADTATGHIESVDANGENRILHVITSDVISITHTDNTLFWTKSKSPYINWIEKSDPLKHVNHLKLDISEEFDDSNELIVITPHNFVENISSSCLNDNGGCSHLCLVSSESPKKSVCACPVGLALAMDGSTCKSPHKCSSKQFTCYTGECISSSKICDKRKDCLHGEDESVDVCRSQCPEGQFLCHDRSKCIDAKSRCDGKFDCNDHSDENCDTNCTKGMFRCDNGECIETQFRCDGKVDCNDGLDERNCQEVTCEEDKFKCTSGQCIPLAWHCDGENDCVDGSDEIRCISNICNPDDFHCTNGECVERSAVCDGHDDCGDNSDENEQFCMKTDHVDEENPSFIINHPAESYHLCNIGIEFQCETKSGRHCIPISQRCDGKINCLNGTDEQNCSECPREYDFRCKNNKKCIPHEWVCDHHDDCGDNSDETKIACLSKNVARKECAGFLCTNGECIALKNVCNDIPDCSDKSDEGGQCDRCDNFGCSDKCHETPSGPYCSCHNGFELGTDNKTCYDIDECQLGVCAQSCTNTPGSFVCSCYSSKYSLKSDRVSCKANGEAAHFLTATLDELKIVTNNWQRISHPIHLPTGRIITAIDVDNKNTLIYTVWDHSLIIKIDLLELEIQKIQSLFVYGIAADWITQNVFFIQARTKIMVASFSSKKIATVYETKNSTIISIAVDPVAGYLFWFEHGVHSGVIKRADCNGANVVNITSPIVANIASIVIDSYEEYLYLYEKIHGIIIRVNYDGSNNKIVLPVDSHVTSFSFFGNSIYWVSENSHLHPIQKCKIYGLRPRKCEIIKSAFKNVRYFNVLQENRQKNGSNPCMRNVCSDICTLSPTGPKCLSYDEYGLLPNSNFKFAGKSIEKIETASSFSTMFAYFIILCLIVVLGYFWYRYRKPKSQLFQRFQFHKTPLNKSELLYNSHTSGINEVATNNTENGFLESITVEPIESEFIPINNKSSREPLLKTSSYL